MLVYLFSEIYLIFVLCYWLLTSVKLNRLHLVWFLFITLILTLGVPEWDRSIHIFNLLTPDWSNGSIFVSISYNFGPYIIAVRSLFTILFSFYFLVTLPNSRPRSGYSQSVLPSAESQGHYLLLIILLSFYIILSSYDLILLYISLELLALSSYLLAAMDWQGELGLSKPTNPNTPGHLPLAAEASLKYYILGSISSSFYLLGTSLVYGIKGTLNFGSLAASEALGIPYDNDIFWIGLIFILFYFLFKLSIFPFHQWTPDVFQGVHINITAFFALLPKAVFFFLLPYLIVNFVPLLIFNFDHLAVLSVTSNWNLVPMVLGIISIFIGSFLGLLQSNLKRLLAYSSISNGGFLILALATNSFVGYNSFYFYLIIYLISNINLFTALHYRVNLVQEFKNLVFINPIFTFNFTILLFSLAGVPPLAGFLSKFQIFYSLTNSILCSSYSVSQFLLIVFLGLFLSLFAAFYYLRIIHFFYFFTPAVVPLELPIAKNGSVPDTHWTPDVLPSYLLAISSLLLILLGLYPYPFIEFSNFLTLCI